MYNDKSMTEKTLKNKKKIPECTILLHDIRSIINVGAIFRTADAIHVTQIILTGITPTPIDRFGRKRDDFAKSALGAEEVIPWKYQEKPLSVINSYKKQGYKIVCIEQDIQSIDYKQLKIGKNDKILLIPGNEVDGVPKNILKKTDHILEIPMNGIKESLNVSVATGIILYRLLDQ